jgi:hypothetical protein
MTTRRAALASMTIVLADLLVTAVLAQTSEPRYPGVGPGHYVQETRDAGRFLLLEDKSQWEIAERNRFVTAEWQPMEGISVRFADGDPPFAYELSNIDRDEGVAARWVRR